jgi:hypothetical protein
VQEETMPDDLDELLDSLFHGCALAAYIDQARDDGQWPPDSEATKWRAYRYYEEELAARNQQKRAAEPTSGTVETTCRAA